MHLWLRAGEPLVCPKGHRLKHNAALLEHEAFVCQQGTGGSAQQGQCGLRCYVLVLPGGLRFVAEVSPHEMMTMRDRRMNVEDVLTFLQSAA